MPFKQGHRGHHESWRAEPAHEAVALTERLLHRMQHGAAGKSLDGTDILALHFNSERRTRVYRSPVHDHRTGATRPVIANALAPGVIEPVANGIEQRHSRFDREGFRPSVDG